MSDLIESIGRLHWQPGDVLLVKAPLRISDEMGRRIIGAVTAATVAAGWPDAPPILILDGGLSLGVASTKPEPTFVTALRSLTEACETEFGGAEMAEWADEDTVADGAPGTKPCALTFGHIRAAPAELDRVSQ